MKIVNYLEHTSCANYKTDFHTGFKYLELEAGEHLEEEQKPVHHLVFIISGSVKVQCDAFQEIELGTAEILFFPKAASCMIHVMEETKLLILSFDNNMNFCDRYSFQSLAPYTKKMTYTFQALPAREKINDFNLLLISYLQDGLNCGHLHELKLKELFLLFRAYYTKEELAAFFYPIIGTNLDFKSKVLEKVLEAKNTEELAQLVGYPLPEFRKLFHDNFGMTIYQWMLEQKSRNIQYSLMVSDDDMKTIAFRLGFSSLQHFSFYCTKTFGLSPTKLKKSLRDKAVDISPIPIRICEVSMNK